MEDWRKRIERLEQENQAFVVFAEAGSETVQVLSNLREVREEESHFTYAPFHSSQKTYFFSGESFSFPLKRQSNISFSLPVHFEEIDPLYRKAFDLALTELNSGELQKLVLTRKHSERASSKSLLPVVLDLLQFYPNHTIHWLVHPENGEWMGASPELLLEQLPDGTLKTMALAGTLPTKGKWTEKEREEQQMVTDYIRKVWEEGAVEDIQLSEAYDLESGPIKHLKTDIKGEYKGSLNALLQKMHPTPAVAGLPLKSALKAIEKIEWNEREYYSGYFGWKKDGHSRYYVNLRCLKRQNSEVHFFIGGGLTAKSDLNREWQETEEKRATLDHFWRRNEN